jgi:ABC-type transporter MlaC component
VRRAAIQLIACPRTRLALAATSVQVAPVPRAAIAQAPTANPAQTFVQQNIDKGYEILNNMKISESERHTQFRDFLLGLIDSRRISVFTLGHYANGRPADIDAFISAFTDYAEVLYERRLNQYKDQNPQGYKLFRACCS